MGERPSSRAQRAKQRLLKALAGEPGLVGAGVSADRSGREEIVVLVTDPASPILTKVPSEWHGFPVRTQVAGHPKKF